MEQDRRRETPVLAQLALVDWSAAAEARVDSVLVLRHRAAVNLLVNGDYEYSVQFVQDEHGEWYESCSSSGHMSLTDLRVLADDD